jgi:hypothetical protein
MSGEERRQYNVAELSALVAQVDSKCPLCGVGLFYSKKSRTYRGFEVAHIYPLNPSATEEKVLENEPRLHDDVNHLDNLIPLCTACHTKFDKPRTVEEYRKLFEIKSKAIQRAKQREIQAAYDLEREIGQVVDALHTAIPVDGKSELAYDPKSIGEKLSGGMPLPTTNKIKHNVADYYQFVREKFLEIERENPTVTELIYVQVKALYLKQKSLGLSQQEIFAHVVEWLSARTKPKTIEAAEIVASFFVQNCEVFE